MKREYDGKKIYNKNKKINRLIKFKIIVYEINYSNIMSKLSDSI
jgi:hypothetical protein